MGTMIPFNRTDGTSVHLLFTMLPVGLVGGIPISIISAFPLGRGMFFDHYSFIFLFRCFGIVLFIYSYRTPTITQAVINKALYTSSAQSYADSQHTSAP